jgi:hypothetical protein
VGVEIGFHEVCKKMKALIGRTKKKKNSSNPPKPNHTPAPVFDYLLT